MINHLYELAEKLGAIYVETVDEKFTTYNSSSIITDTQVMKVYKFKEE